MIYAFACTVKDSGWPETIINTITPGKAKQIYHNDVTDCWPDVKFTDVRVRKLGGPHTSESFVRNAVYRGMPNVKCGQRVKVGDSTGWIVGHNSSANFNVLFDEGRLTGGTYNVHPSEIALVDEHPTQPAPTIRRHRDRETAASIEQQREAEGDL